MYYREEPVNKLNQASFYKNTFLLPPRLGEGVRDCWASSDCVVGSPGEQGRPCVA